MTELLAIDPGVRDKCACALFIEDELKSVWFEAHADARRYTGAPPLALLRVVVERPEYHGARSDAARTQDLLALSWAGAALAYAYGGAADAPVIERGVGEWKGSEPKPVMHARLWRVLSDAERALLGGGATHAAIAKAVEKGALRRWKAGGVWYPRKFVAHNLMDAAALGSWELGRLKRKGTL